MVYLRNLWGNEAGSKKGLPDPKTQKEYYFQR